MMKISTYVKKEYCIMDLKARTKEEAIAEIVASFGTSGKVKDKNAFIAEIMEREALGSTGIGYGVAIPHARTEGVEEFIIGFGRSKEGIDFNALDGAKVNLIFVMGSNPKDMNLYLRLLAELAKNLMDENFRKTILLANSVEEVISAFQKSGSR